MLNSYRRRRRANRRAFTLVELLVAIGVISFLIVGIGQIFRSVGGLVSVGTAVAEVEQMARAIERQLRDDFAALSAMRSEDTFIAIRMREIGDLNRNDERDGDEKAVYLNEDDRNADIRDISDGVFDDSYNDGSRAVTVRLDEIMFLAVAPVGGTYTSFEQSRYGNMTATAPVARIYYGHSLRPPRDPNWPSTESDAPRVPQRIFIPDGDFAEGIPDPDAMMSEEENRFFTVFMSEYDAATDADFGDATGRNEHASSWMLSRQALLLVGGNAAGNGDSPYGPSLFQNEREYAPFIRDLESIDRFWQSSGAGPGVYGYGLDHQGPRSGAVNQTAGIFEPPGMRLIHHGRTDMIAQDLEDVQRWLEGEPWPIGGSNVAPLGEQESYAFSDGRFGIGVYQDAYLNASPSSGISEAAFGNLSNTTFTPTVRGLLWQQPDPTLSNNEGFYLTRRGVRGAIAGAFTRLLADDEPAHFDRIRDFSTVTYPNPMNFEPPSDPEDVYMDAHTILAEHCSNFEIAWRYADPDWPVANEDIDIDNDGTPEFRIGDRIWFDISFLDPTNPNSRSTLQNWLNYNPMRGFDIGRAPSFGATPTNAFTNSPFIGAESAQQPEVGYAHFRAPTVQPFDRFFTPNNGGPVASGATTVHSNFGNLNSGNGFPAVYNPDITGGAPEGVSEYLAIWPFRTPSLSGGFTDEAFPKKLQIRVRLTLHDSQNRIKGGRTFEFVFDVSPQQ